MLLTTASAFGVLAIVLYCGPSRNERLRRAVLADDLLAVNWWLFFGADPDAGQGTYGWNPSPLQIAVIRECSPIVESLINAGAFLDYRDQRARTAMLYAAQAGNWEIVRSLFQAGGEHRYIGNDDKSVLDHAELSGRQEVIEIFAERPTPKSCWTLLISDGRLTDRSSIGARDNREFKLYYIPAQYDGLSDGWIVKQFSSVIRRGASGEIITEQGPESVEIDESGNKLLVTYPDGSSEFIPI